MVRIESTTGRRGTVIKYLGRCTEAPASLFTLYLCFVPRRGRVAAVETGAPHAGNGVARKVAPVVIGWRDGAKGIGTAPNRLWRVSWS